MRIVWRGCAVVIVALGQPKPACAQSYQDPPPVLTKATRDAAALIVKAELEQAGDGPGQLNTFWNGLVFYALADALPGVAGKPGIRDVSPYWYLGELKRNDKQLGSAAGASGSTSAVERPGLPMFLSLAIEHGAIEKSVSGTSVSLSTTPYAFLKLFERDSPSNFEKYGLWRRLGVSASLPLSDTSATASNLNLRGVSAWSVRVRAYGDHSTRSKEFARLWQQRIQPKIQKRLDALTRGLAQTFNSAKAFSAIKDSLRTITVDTIKIFLASHKDSADSTVTELANLILSALEKGIRLPITEDKLQVPDTVEAMVTNELVPALQATHRDLQGIDQEVNEIVDQVNRGPLLTIEYTNHRADSLSGRSEVQLLFQGRLAPLDIIANAGVDFYHHPDPVRNQSTVRSYEAAVTLQGVLSQGLFPMSASSGGIVLSASGRLSRVVELDDFIAIAQLKLEVPLSPGVNLPLSVTYANRTDLIDESEVRGNFGVTVDFDKLYALSHRLIGQP